MLPNTQFSGIKVEFSEDLKKIKEGKFSGWMQILPAAGGKDKALRFVMEKIAAKINPLGEVNKRLQASVVGDAAIDIWMLAMGTNARDSYDVRGYALGNLTPYAKGKLAVVQESLENHREKGWRQAHLTILKEEASAGVAKVANLFD